MQQINPTAAFTELHRVCGGAAWGKCPGHRGKKGVNVLNSTNLPSDSGGPEYFADAVTLREMAMGPDVDPNKVLRAQLAPGEWLEPISYAQYRAI